MSVDLTQTLDLHQRIRSELDQREAATKEKAAEARRAFDAALRDIAAELDAAKQYRELLAQAEILYRGFLGTNHGDGSTTVVQPTQAPVAVTIPEQASAPALTIVSEEQPRAETENIAREPVSLARANGQAEISSPVDNLRSQIADLGHDESSGNRWWPGKWKNGSRNPDQEIDWKKPLPPIEGAERPVWDHPSANQAQG